MFVGRLEAVWPALTGIVKNWRSQWNLCLISFLLFPHTPDHAVGGPVLFGHVKGLLRLEVRQEPELLCQRLDDEELAAADGGLVPNKGDS